MKDKKKYNLKAIEQLAITISLMLILLVGNSLNYVEVSSAEEPNTDIANAPIVAVEGSKEEVSKITNIECQTKLAEFADPEFDKYKKFMEDNFQNKSTTSSLMDLAIQRYDKFKTDIRSQLELMIGRQLNVAQASGSSDATQLNGLDNCEKQANDYINNAAKLLQMRAVTTSGIKKASIFVEKYQQVNGKLRDMEQDIMRMVTNISSFQQKLPCYLKTCA